MGVQVYVEGVNEEETQGPRGSWAVSSRDAGMSGIAKSAGALYQG